MKASIEVMYPLHWGSTSPFGPVNITFFMIAKTGADSIVLEGWRVAHLAPTTRSQWLVVGCATALENVKKADGDFGSGGVLIV
jgi:hypothetical protein